VSDGSMGEGWRRVRPYPQRPLKEQRAVLGSKKCGQRCYVNLNA
jgi:hypothetical protein